MKSVISQVLEISRQHMGIDCLDVRNSDHLDFHDLHVDTVRAGLTEAFLQGQRSMVEGINWPQLRIQKLWLMNHTGENADGLIHLLDWIQDSAVAAGVDSRRVFGYSDETVV